MKHASTGAVRRECSHEVVERDSSDGNLEIGIFCGTCVTCGIHVNMTISISDFNAVKFKPRNERLN